MDCTESLPLLSDLHDGALDETLRTQVRTHLAECPPCHDVFSDISQIVNVAVALNLKPQLAFPDEDAFWRRMRIADPTIH